MTDLLASGGSLAGLDPIDSRPLTLEGGCASLETLTCRHACLCLCLDCAGVELTLVTTGEDLGRQPRFFRSRPVEISQARPHKLPILPILPHPRGILNWGVIQIRLRRGEQAIWRLTVPIPPLATRIRSDELISLRLRRSDRQIPSWPEGAASSRIAEDDADAVDDSAVGGQGGIAGLGGAGGAGGAALGGGIGSIFEDHGASGTFDASLTVQDTSITLDSALGGAGRSGSVGGAGQGGGLYSSEVDTSNGSSGDATLMVLGTTTFTADLADGGSGGVVGQGTGGAIFIDSGEACLASTTTYTKDRASTADDDVSGTYTTC